MADGVERQSVFAWSGIIRLPLFPHHVSSSHLDIHTTEARLAVASAAGIPFYSIVCISIILFKACFFLAQTSLYLHVMFNGVDISHIKNSGAGVLSLLFSLLLFQLRAGWLGGTRIHGC